MMISHDLQHLARFFAETRERGRTISPTAMGAIAAVLDDMAAQVRHVEGAPVPQGFRLDHDRLPAGVIPFPSR